MQGSFVDIAYAAASFLWAGLGAVCDVRTRRIPNWLTGSGILAGLLLQFALGGWRAMGGAALGGLIAGAVFLVFYVGGGMGAGDVKLIVAVCCLAGLHAVANILVGTALIGGLLAIALALVHRRLTETVANVGRLFLYHGSSGLRPHPDLNVTNPRTLRLPYGLAIAAGAGWSLSSVLLR
jgi:prepilin peptidase CpaA